MKRLQQVQPLILIVALLSTLAALPSITVTSPENTLKISTVVEATSTNVMTETPTVNPKVLFGKIANGEVTAETKLIPLAPIEKIIVVNSEEYNVTSLGGAVHVIQEGFQIPTDTKLSPPCETGLEFYKTGNDFVWFNDWHTEGYHPGLDGRCRIPGQKNPLEPAKATSICRAVVTKVFENLSTSEGDSVDFWSSGRTYVTQCLVDGVKFYAIYGHLQFLQPGELWPNVGEVVESGQPLGVIGETGRAFGYPSKKHIHLGLMKELPNGELTWLNPGITLGVRQ